MPQFSFSFSPGCFHYWFFTIPYVAYLSSWQTQRLEGVNFYTSAWAGILLQAQCCYQTALSSRRLHEMMNHQDNGQNSTKERRRNPEENFILRHFTSECPRNWLRRNGCRRTFVVSMLYGVSAWFHGWTTRYEKPLLHFSTSRAWPHSLTSAGTHGHKELELHDLFWQQLHSTEGGNDSFADSHEWVFLLRPKPCAHGCPSQDRNVVSSRSLIYSSQIVK